MKRMCACVCVIVWACLAIVAGGGCSHAPLAETPTPATPADPPAAISAAEYDAVFDAAVETLRDMRFDVDRKDRRFGVVTTEPLIASSFVEPWYADNTTAAQALESTLHKQRRRVRVAITPASGAAAMDAAGARVAGQGYELQVVAEVERQYHPPRPIHTSALGRVSSRRADRRYRPVETEAGVEESYWMSLGRDALLERRLAEMILRRAAGAETTAAR